MANRRTQSSKNRKIDEDSDFEQDFGPSPESVPSEGEQQRKYAFDCVSRSPHRLYTSVFERISLLITFSYIYIRIIAALKGELIKYRRLNFVRVGTTKRYHRITKERKGRKGEEVREGEKIPASSRKASRLWCTQCAYMLCIHRR